MRLIERLSCNVCRSALRHDGDGLRCANGHHVPVRDGVPRFVEDDGYAANFGFEWTKFDRTQLDGAHAASAWSRDLYGQGVTDAASESERTFELKTGLCREELEGKLVLDAGCGTGRFADVAERFGAHVVGVDLTRAVDTARRNLRGRNVDIVQANLLEMPFRPQTFDVIYSIGVLHHTPDTYTTWKKLVPLLKPGGIFAVWLYERAAWRRPWLPPAQFFSDTYRVVTTRMPPSVLLPLCRARAELGDAVTHPVAKRVLRKLIPANEHPDLEWRTLDIYDWYSPKYQWKHTTDEVVGWYRDAGFEDVRVERVPVAVRGRLPAA